MPSQSFPELLDELVIHFGIASDYYDIFGQRHVIGPDTKRAILSAMGVTTATAEDLARELAACRDESWRTACEPVLVCRAGDLQRTWSFRLPSEVGEDAAIHIEWTIKSEHDQCRVKGHAGPSLTVTAARTIGEQRYVQVELPLPGDLDIGYYDVIATGSTPTQGVEGRMRLILTPVQCYLPQYLEARGRFWGLSLQLYALRSATNWGVGDFSDLDHYVQWAGQLGAGVIGLNPLHALKNTRPFHISPYSPTSRLYLNPLYIDVERVPEWIDCSAARDRVDTPLFRSQLEALRQQQKVDYERVYTMKKESLMILFDAFAQRHCGVDEESLQPRTARGRAFAEFVRREGDALETFAVFQSLCETLAKQQPDALVWQQWPEPYRHPRSSAVAVYRMAHWPSIRFHQYLQWVAAEQVGAVSQRAERLGMPVGLYHDLALGSDRTGSDAWMYQDVLALDAACGAPPDAFAMEGQNWGLPPPIPHRLRQDAYRMFIELLRKNLQYGGALRVDHVMALFRLFWVPKSFPASAGAYVSYPWEDLLGILALESIRHRTIIVGEDLGTVPDFVREQLAAFRVLSYRVFYFERRHDGEFKSPREYPRDALAVVSTHDLPTLAGYWAEQDLDLRLKLGLYTDGRAFHQALEERRAEKARILRALEQEGLLPNPTGEHRDGRAWSTELRDAIHAYLARTDSCLTLVSLEDLLGERAQVNLPGTVDAYPNWSLKIPMSLEALRVDRRAEGLATVLNGFRPRPAPPPSL